MPQKVDLKTEVDEEDEELFGDINETDTFIGREESINDVKDKEKNVSTEKGVDRNDSSHLPIDRGWAWVILGASVFSILIFGGIMKSFGLYFLQYQRRFNSSASDTAIMSMIQNIVSSITALFVMSIGVQKLGSRVTIIVGGTLTFISYIVVAFAKDLWVFYLVQGVIGGVGLAHIFPPIVSMLGTYFDRHRGLANSIFSSSASLGGLVFGPLIVKLFDEYEYTGTLMITAALLLNLVPTGLLMIPIESYHKRKPDLPENNDTKKPSAKINGQNNEIKMSKVTEKHEEFSTSKRHNFDQTNFNPTFNPRSKFVRMYSFDPRGQPPSPVQVRARASSVGHKRIRTISEVSYDEKRSTNKLENIVNAISHSKTALYASNDVFMGSYIDLREPTVESIEESSKDDNSSKDEACKFGSCIIDVFKTIFDLTILKDPMFILYLTMAFCTVSSVALLAVYIAPYAKDVGISNEQIGLMISVLGGIDIVAKILFGVIADRKWVERTIILAGCACVTGICAHLMRFVTSFGSMMIMIVILGICNGQYNSMHAVVLIEVIGPAKFKQSLGFGTLAHGTSIALFFPLAGLLRDNTGSYIASFHMFGTLSFISVLQLLGLTFLQRRRRKNELTEPKTDI